MIPYKFTRIIKLDTKEIGVICSIYYGTDCVYKIYWSNRNFIENIKEDHTFFDKYKLIEEENTDITKDHIIKYLTDIFGLGIISLINRRLVSNYYVVGAVVFFTLPGYIPYNREAFGPEYPFIIVSNTVNENFSGENCFFTIRLCRFDRDKGTDIDSYSPSYYNCISIVSSLSSYSKEDCYSLLSRYDSKF